MSESLAADPAFLILDPPQGDTLEARHASTVVHALSAQDWDLAEVVTSDERFLARVVSPASPSTQATLDVTVAEGDAPPGLSGTIRLVQVDGGYVDVPVLCE